MNAQLRQEAGIGEKIFVIVALLLFTNPFTAIIPLEQRNNVELLTFYSIYIITFFIIRNNLRNILTMAGREKFLICLLVITAFSTIWSDFPLITLRRSVAIIGTSLFGIYLAERYTLKEQLHLLGIMLGIAATLSLLFILLLPAYGLSRELQYEGAWQGIFEQKNILGHTMLVSAIVFFLLYIGENKFRWIKLALLILTFALLIRSQSTTAMMLVLVLYGFMLLYKSLQWNFYVRAIFVFLYILLAIGIVSWISENQNFILNVVGRDTTLTGRTDLWEVIIQMVEKRLFLGYGFNAFWLKGGAGEYVRDLVGWDTPHSHNGILDMWLEIGLVGVFAFGLSFLQAFYNSIKLAKKTNTWEEIWPLLYLTQLLLINLAESSIFHQNSIYWMLYVAIATFFYRNSDLSLNHETHLGVGIRHNHENCNLRSNL